MRFSIEGVGDADDGERLQPWHCVKRASLLSTSTQCPLVSSATNIHVQDRIHFVLYRQTETPTRENPYTYLNRSKLTTLHPETLQPCGGSEHYKIANANGSFLLSHRNWLIESYRSSIRRITTLIVIFFIFSFFFLTDKQDVCPIEITVSDPFLTFVRIYQSSISYFSSVRRCAMKGLRVKAL